MFGRDPSLKKQFNGLRGTWCYVIYLADWMGMLVLISALRQKQEAFHLIRRGVDLSTINNFSGGGRLEPSAPVDVWKPSHFAFGLNNQHQFKKKVSEIYTR